MFYTLGVLAARVLQVFVSSILKESHLFRIFVTG